MVAWHSRVFGDTRSKILEILRVAPHTAVDLATDLGLTNNAVRQHLASLGAHGLVEHAGVRRETGGKPAQLYALSPTGEELFPKGYAAVLVGIIDELGSVPTGLAPEELLRRTGERLAAQVKVPPSVDFAGRVGIAADALHALGGDMEVERIADDVWQMRASGCPLAAVVAERPVACELVRSFIRGVTGGYVSECCGQSESCAASKASNAGAARAGCVFTVKLDVKPDVRPQPKPEVAGLST